MKKRHTARLSEFLQDARGEFNVFTLISLQAGFTLVSAPLVNRWFAWPALSKDETWALVLIYCISALSDYLLSIYLNKLPSTLIQNTEGGDAGLAVGPEATNNGPSPEAPPSPQP